jgi:DNA polymerase III subunit gamma/tau
VSIALARKYRPRTFADVAVQTHVATALRGAIARDRIAHGYLFCGPRGTGKTTLARVLAMALNCEQRSAEGEPCGSCGSCTRIWSGSASLDVVEMDAASNRGVDDARELRERAMYAPSGDDRYKVYIVDEAHMLTREAWNTLLKILEEPPPRVVFVFATTDPQKIAQAAAPVLSRLQRFELRRIGSADIRERVGAVLASEGIDAEPDALRMIARAADGSMRDALSLTDQVLAFGDVTVTAEGVRLALGLVGEDELLGLLDLVAERRAGDVFAAVARLADGGADFAVLLAHLADLLRAQLALELGGALPEVGEGLAAALAERQGRLAAPDLVRMLTLLVEHEPVFRKSSQPQMLFEMLLVRFALLDRTVTLEEVLRGVGGGGGGPSARAEVSARGADSAARPAPLRAAPPVMREAAPPVPRDAAPAAHRDAGAPSMRASATAGVAPAPALREAPPSRPAAAPRPSGPPPAPPLADAAPPPAGAQPLDLNRVAEHWDDLIAGLRAQGRGLVAQLLEGATPVAVTAAGGVTLEAEDALAAQGLSEAVPMVVEALRLRFPSVRTVTVLGGAEAAPHKRYDAAAVKAERTASLRRDPVLDAAITALDLELLE